MTTFIFCPFNEQTMDRRLKTIINNKGNKPKGYFKSVVHMGYTQSEEQFLATVKYGDTIEIHGEGLPWIVGSDRVDPNTDYPPFRLADYFAKLLSEQPDIKLTIDVQTCFSGVMTEEKGFCYIEKFSAALADLGIFNVQVRGYTGLIRADDGKAKLSVASHYSEDELPKGSKIKGSSMQDAAVVYQNGRQTQAPKKILRAGFPPSVKDTTYKLYKKDEKRFNKEKLARQTLQDTDSVKNYAGIMAKDESVGSMLRIGNALLFSAKPSELGTGQENDPSLASLEAKSSVLQRAIEKVEKDENLATQKISSNIVRF